MREWLNTKPQSLSFFFFFYPEEPGGLIQRKWREVSTQVHRWHEARIAVRVWGWLKAWATRAPGPASACLHNPVVADILRVPVTKFQRSRQSSHFGGCQKKESFSKLYTKLSIICQPYGTEVGCPRSCIFQHAGFNTYFFSMPCFSTLSTCWVEYHVLFSTCWNSIFLSTCWNSIYGIS
jgi:hypothetical protein